MQGSEGEKITITLDGQISKDKIIRALDMFELLGGSKDQVESRAKADMSKFEKLQLVLDKRFPIGWFTSQDVMVAYEDLFDEPIGLSTVSTYLARLVDREVLMKSGSQANRRYRVKRAILNRETTPI
jgi:hypothetical protein